MSSRPVHILVVDDEPHIRESLSKVLERDGYAVTTAADAGAALACLARQPVEIVISDVMMPEMDGITLLKRIRETREDIEVLLITGHASVERAVEAMREGAWDYISKPFKRADILTRVERVVEKRRLSRENRVLKTQLRRSAVRTPLVGTSPQIRRIREMIEQVAPTHSTVLIWGESGTGKEIIARMVHDGSGRMAQPFVAVNCGAIAENVIESELFGHVKGAFTGAVSDREGLFKTADGGSLFLDEIVSLPQTLQVKLLRVLEEREIRPVGSARTVPIDVRILAACNENLHAAVEAGRFREDLFYRLNVFAIQVPPLRERRDDIAPLTQHFIRAFSSELNKAVAGISEDVLKMLMALPWKGNVRELRNAIEHAMILSGGPRIEIEDLPLRYHSPRGNGAVSAPDLKGAVAAFERQHIERIVRDAGGDKREAARRLGLGLSSLYRKLKELGIEA